MKMTQPNKQTTTNPSTIRDNGEGLLWRFIGEKLHTYTPRARKGTPRGEQIGFPYDKYQAALLIALMGVSMREMAEREDVKISYDLLRKWSTESEFKELVLKFREEFTERFIQHFRSSHEDNSKRWAEHYDEEVSKVINPRPEEQRQAELEEFGLQDNRLYSPDLLADVYNRIGAEVRGGDTSAIFWWLNVANMLLSSSHRQSHRLLRRLNYEILRHHSITQLQQAKTLLQSREKATPEDSQFHIRLLDQVQRFLEWPPLIN